MAFIKDFTQFYGGISKNDYLNNGTQVIYSDQVDFIRDAGFVQLGRDIEEEIITTDAVSAFVTANSNVFAGTEDGKVYSVSTGDIVFTPTGNFAGDVIRGMILFNSKVHIFVRGSAVSAGIFTILESNATTGANDWDADIITSTSDPEFDDGDGLNPAFRYPAVNIGPLLYFGHGTKLGKIDTSSVFTADVLSLDVQGEIVGVTYSLNKLNLYTEDGFKYIVDIGSEVIISRVDFKQAIRFVHSDGDIDWVFFATEPTSTTTFLVQGVSKQFVSRSVASSISKDVKNFDVRKFSFGLDSAEGNISNSAIYKEVTYLPAVATKRSFYGVGRPIENLPLTFQEESMESSSGFDFNKISALHVDGTKLFIGYEDVQGTPQSGVDSVDLGVNGETNFHTTGDFILPPFTAGFYRKKKRVREIVVGCKIPAGQTVVIAFKVDGDGSGGTSTVYHTISDTTRFYHNLLNTSVATNQIPPFSELVLHITLNGSGANTPKFYDLAIIGEFIDNFL